MASYTASAPRQESFAQLLDFSKLDRPIQLHLQKVYGTLSMTAMVCAAGVLCSINGIIPAFLVGNLLTFLGIIGLTVALTATPPTKENQNKRLGMLMGTAFLMGMNMAPLVDAVLMINPQIVFTALLVSCAIFTCFTLAALLAGNDRQYLFLGGILMSGLSTLMIVRLLGVLFGWKAALDLTVYMSLFILCGFVLYDTQLIILKRKRGDEDYLKHALDLFIDFAGIFKHIMVILAQKEERNQRNKRRSN